MNTLAYAYTLKGEEEKALEIYEKVIQRSPYDKNALYNIGILLWNKGDREEARRSFNSLYEIDPKDSIILYNLGLLEIELENREAGIKYLELYLEGEPSDTDAMIVVGDAYRDEQRYGDALEYYDKVIAGGTAEPELYFKKAYILLTAIGDTEKGREALEQAISGEYKEKELYQQLAEDPELIEKEQIRQFLLDKGLIEEKSELEKEQSLLL